MKNEDKILIAMGIVMCGIGLVSLVLIIMSGGSLDDMIWLPFSMLIIGPILIWQGFKHNKERKTTI